MPEQTNDNTVKHRKLQKEVMWYPRPSNLLEGIIYDMICLERRQRRGPANPHLVCDK